MSEQIPTLKVPFPLSRDTVFLPMASLIKEEVSADADGGFVCGHYKAVEEKRTWIFPSLVVLSMCLHIVSRNRRYHNS